MSGPYVGSSTPEAAASLGPGGTEPVAQTAAVGSAAAAGDAQIVIDDISTEDGVMSVTGWATASGPVDIIIDGTIAAQAETNAYRPDVEQAYGPGATIVGFQAAVAEPALWQQVCVAPAGSDMDAWACNRDYLLPHKRIVSYYGAPGAPVLGIIGEGSPSWALGRLQSQTAAFDQYERETVPAFEMIATVAQPFPGPYGNYSIPIPTEQLWEYLDVIREVGGILILDFQPGTGTYMQQIEDYEEILSEPDVHVGLDPEWDMPWGTVPGSSIGWSSAAEVNGVLNWLDDLVVANDLPPKLVVVHQFTPYMITNREDLRPPPNVQVLLQMDGWGGPALKASNYERLSVEAPLYNGFKVFYRYDSPNLYPGSIMQLDPEVDLISYQ